MGRLNYEFDKEPLEVRKISPAMRRVRVAAIFCAVALVTGGVIYALVPHKKAEAEKNPLPPTPTEEKAPAPVESTAGSSEKPAEPAQKLPTAETPAETVEPAEPAEKTLSEMSGKSEAEAAPAESSGKGVVLPSDPPAAQDQPVREGVAASDLEMLKNQAVSGDLEALTKAFDTAAPGSVAKAQYGLALGAARAQMWQNGSWKRDAVTHRVVSGDNLSKLAKRYHTTIEFIRYANKLKNNNIRIGQKLAIMPGKWSVEIDKKARLLTVFQFNGEAKKSYGAFEIGIGRQGRTPKGDFVISYRLRHPDWHTSDGRVIPYGDKENVLGDYFLKLAAAGKADRPLLGYGIHGTNDETTVGRSLSNGCIRMRGNDVEMLYYLLPSGTPVIITE